MKKQYLEPEAEIVALVNRSSFVCTSTSGEDLSNRSYGAVPGEDVNDFWE